MILRFAVLNLKNSKLRKCGCGGVIGAAALLAPSIQYNEVVRRRRPHRRYISTPLLSESLPNVLGTHSTAVSQKLEHFKMHSRRLERSTSARTSRPWRCRLQIVGPLAAVILFSIAFVQSALAQDSAAPTAGQQTAPVGGVQAPTTNAERLPPPNPIWLARPLPGLAPPRHLRASLPSASRSCRRTSPPGACSCMPIPS